MTDHPVPNESPVETSPFHPLDLPWQPGRNPSLVIGKSNLATLVRQAFRVAQELTS